MEVTSLMLMINFWSTMQVNWVKDKLKLLIRFKVEKE